MNAADITERQVVEKFRHCRREALGSREWKDYSHSLRLANRMMRGDQRPEDIKEEESAEWFSIPLMPRFVAQLAGMLTGPRSRVFVTGSKSSVNEVLSGVIEARLLEMMEEQFFAAQMNRGALDIIGRGNAAIIGMPVNPHAHDADQYNVPVKMRKIDPGQVWFSPAARGHTDPQLGSPYVGVEFLEPVSSVIADFPEHLDMLRNFKTYGFGHNPIADDQTDPLYALYESLKQEASGPVSLYDFDRAPMRSEEGIDARQSFALVRRTRFWWRDTIVVDINGRKQAVGKWFRAEFVEQDGSDDPRAISLLWWGPINIPSPGITLASNWLDADSPYGKSVYALSGSLVGLIDAVFTMIFREMATDHQWNEMAVYDENALTDKRQRAILEAGDKQAALGLNLRNARSLRDVFQRMESTTNATGAQLQYAATLVRMLEDVIGLPAIARGQTGTPGQRLTGPVADALQSAAMNSQTPEAFVMDVFQTHVGRMMFELARFYDYGEAYVPRSPALGGFTINKQVPLEEADDLANLAIMDFPQYQGEFAVPNGLRGFRANGPPLDLPFSERNVARLMGDEEVTGINVILNAIGHIDAKIRVMSEADYQNRRQEFLEALAMTEQYRQGQISTETIMQELFRAFPDIDAVSEMERRYGELGAERYMNLPVDVKAIIDQQIDRLLMAQAPQGQPQGANVAPTAAPEASA